MADGYIEFSTRLDNSDLEKQLKEAENDIERLKKKLEERESDRNVIADALKAADASIKATEENIERLKARYEELMQASDAGEIDISTANARIEVITQELDKQRDILQKQEDAAYEIAKRWEKNENAIKSIPGELQEATERANKLGKEYAKAYGLAATKFGSGIKAMNRQFDTFISGITKKLKNAFGIAAIVGLISSFFSYVKKSVAASEQFIAASNNLKAVLAGLAAPIIQIVIPAFTAMVNVISAVLITLARLVDSVFKTNFVGSIADAQNAMISSANAQQSATGATDDNTKAVKRNTKARKEAVRWLAAFDELNVMQKEDSGDNDYDTPLDTIAPTSDAEAPTWAGIDVGKIDETLAEIMLIIGAALIAVGAILAFSGINIPLGITLMAIGALMVYTAAQEQWDKLPQEVRDAINGALIFTGIVLIVIGLVLAFAVPTFQALGIGMIAAGALLIWTAVALNWDEMPAEIQQAVSVIMAILGVALLVIGAILTFTAANPALGVALMALGAASLAADVALNWESMPDEVKRTVEDILEIVGTAFLVLGAILTLASPATAPLGVGLLLIGAASLATAVALQWETMPQKTRDMVSTIGAIVGAALIVLGIFCLVTGVGIPLGMALIIAGAGSLAAAVAVNWDALQEKIKEVWENIKSWFNDSVAQIFTTEFWADKFKGIVNGLISMLNEGLSAFGGFVNDLAGGVSDILDFFGVGNYWFRIDIPQIPYLAQGAVIPPNRKFMAVLGDQSNGTNLEAPENLIRQIVREESGVGSGEIVNLLGQMLVALQARQTLECDGYTLAKVVNDRNVTMNKLHGVV